MFSCKSQKGELLLFILLLGFVAYTLPLKCNVCGHKPVHGRGGAFYDLNECGEIIQHDCDEELFPILNYTGTPGSEDCGFVPNAVTSNPNCSFFRTGDARQGTAGNDTASPPGSPAPASAPPTNQTGAETPSSGPAASGGPDPAPYVPPGGGGGGGGNKPLLQLDEDPTADYKCATVIAGGGMIKRCLRTFKEGCTKMGMAQWCYCNSSDFCNNEKGSSSRIKNLTWVVFTLALVGAASSFLEIE